MSANPFSVFDREKVTLTLTRTSGTTAGTYNSDHVWVPASPVTSEIEGHITTIDRGNRESEWGRTPADPMETGSMRFFTETLLQKGDTLQLEQDDGSIETYRVIGLVRAQRLMAKTLGIPLRYEFSILQVPR